MTTIDDDLHTFSAEALVELVSYAEHFGAGEALAIYTYIDPDDFDLDFDAVFPVAER